jgi:hypothetical protein
MWHCDVGGLRSMMRGAIPWCKGCVIVLCVSAAHAAGFAQGVPAGFGPRSHEIALGAGGSTFNADWAGWRVEGETFWIDYKLAGMPRTLNGLGIEVEGRDLNSRASSSPSKNFRLYTIGGGIIYQWPRFKSIRPYGKCLLDFGNIDWDNPNPRFRHETRTVTAPGMDVDFRVGRGIWIRADYEYQFWPDIATFRPRSDHVLDPYGFTFGVSYKIFRTRG